MKKVRPKLQLARVTVADLDRRVQGAGWFRSYGDGCSDSCNTCYEGQECYVPSDQGHVCPEAISMGFFTC